jgi:dihydropteroate synthase
VIPERIADRDDAEDVLSRAGVGEAEPERVADDLVHYTVETGADAREARALREAMERLGGTGAISAIDAADRERREVVLAGTREEFLRLVGAIESGALPAVRSDLARDVRDAVGSTETEPDPDPGRGPDPDVTEETTADETAIDETTIDGATTRGTATGDPAESGESGRDGPDAGGSSAYPWHDRTAIMGVLNTTPDSFHDGGRYEVISDAVARAEGMVAAGADVIDVGGESTRPGADPVPVEEEIERVRPVIERTSEFDALVSIDTRKAAVARAALDAGADILNDVTGLEDPAMRFVAADYGVPIVLMHSIDAPVVPGKEMEYDDVVADAIAELGERVRLAEQAGVPKEDIIVDPGIGFGKSSAESFDLLGRIDAFHALGCSVLAGHSHKSMFDLAGASEEGLAATVAGSAIAADRGADVVRVHDVGENVAAVRVAEAASDPERFGDPD